METQTGRKIKILRTDNGSEYESNDFKKFIKVNGIRHELTVPYTLQQNGVAERMNRTVIEKAKSLLFDANLKKHFWAEAVNMAAYIINRCPSHNRIPDEIFYGQRVDLSGLRIFGCDVMVHVPKEKRRKLDKKSSKMIFVGYDEHRKGYRCIDQKTLKLTISRDVIFHEKCAEAPVRVIVDIDTEVKVKKEVVYHGRN